VNPLPFQDVGNVAARLANAGFNPGAVPGAPPDAKSQQLAYGADILAAQQGVPVYNFTPPPAPSRLPLYLGLGLGAAALLGLVVFLRGRA
jgi:hypothetical protein